MIRKPNRVIAEMQTVLVVWIEDQTSYKIFIKPKSNPDMALNLFNSLKAKRDKRAAEKSLKLPEISSQGLRKKSS